MRINVFISWSMLCLILCGANTLAQEGPATEYQPIPGQAGKDVIWLPSTEALVEKMLDLAKVTPEDYVIDLGSGDGRIVISAAKRGARALGIEYNPDLVEFSRRAAVKAGVADKAKFEKGDIFETDFSQGTVITMFLLNEVILKLRPKLFDMKPGTRLVTNSFTIADWRADAALRVDEKCVQPVSFCWGFLWIVPAKVDGEWRLPQGELTLKQNFQMISGTLKAGNTTMEIREGKLKGKEMTFSLGGAHYAGHVHGDVMEGDREANGKTEKWTATRVDKN